MLLGFLKGFFKVYLPALLIWFFGFYVPYAYSLYYFNYDNGAELPGYLTGGSGIRLPLRIASYLGNSPRIPG